MSSPQVLEHALQTGLEQRIFSAVQAEVGDAQRVLWHTARGCYGYQDPTPITATSRFDIASVTKAVSTGLLCLRACQEARIAFGDMLGDRLPTSLLAANHPLARVALYELLRHCAGLTDWHPFYEDVPAEARGTLLARHTVARHIQALPMWCEPGQGERYSDLGYMLLGWVLEHVWDTPLKELFEHHIRQPLGLTHTAFEGLQPRHAEDVVCTEDITWRGGVIRGVVHDENAWVLGGCAGHAGLFSTAQDLGRMARALLRCDAGEEGWLAPEHIHHAWSRVHRHAKGHHLLGWDTPSGHATSAGTLATREHTVGHLGFTGSSLWIDRQRGAYVVLLTNRVHPSRDNPHLRPFRPMFHDLAWALVDASRAPD